MNKKWGVRSLTTLQARVLLQLINGENVYLGNFHSVGGILSALTRSGYIEPMGRKGRRLKWILLKEFTEEELEMIKKISNYSLE